MSSATDQHGAEVAPSNRPGRDSELTVRHPITLGMPRQNGLINECLAQPLGPPPVLAWPPDAKLRCPPRPERWPGEGTMRLRQRASIRSDKRLTRRLPAARRPSRGGHVAKAQVNTSRKLRGLRPRKLASAVLPHHAVVHPEDKHQAPVVFLWLTRRGRGLPSCCNIRGHVAADAAIEERVMSAPSRFGAERRKAEARRSNFRKSRLRPGGMKLSPIRQSNSIGTAQPTPISFWWKARR
jgi:hypothetical protein